ncbi:hypothetical protein NDU88_000524 [Pleurodeles waltl]|uniref:Laminin subunit gamma-3 n=1 Tax=Pleurodeles waltl TaxID=8319 RepID=A0AAV7Q7K6_PLEWA|nr:hypothetical protein NDU88_000524 [Pleurodeles waltl]
MARAPDPSVLALLLLAQVVSPTLGGMDSCYDQEGAPQCCMPVFENAAYLREPVATNTCGSPPEDYCLQTGSQGTGPPCHRCAARDPDLQHNASALTDLHGDEAPTWWQSQTMALGVQYPNSVNITLHLGKSYEITYVRLKFHTSRPESFAIYKRTRAGGPWVPYQYYSATCQKTYGKSERGYLRPGDDEAVAFCTAEFSDISPLSGGNVAFSTLEGRPSAYNFDRSPVLQEWVTSTDLLISLNRLNTFGDDIFKDKKVLQSYFYAISDLSVGGRCKCNGHARECVTDQLGQLTCNCQHNTTGLDCERCRPFYQDRPWARGTSEAANECQACECHGQSEECFFDPALYRSTGRGGHCRNCRAHTAGPHCELCQETFYRQGPGGPCQPCHCHPAGSLCLQCDSDGHCQCKPSVTGRKCDRCRQGYHSFSEGGCRPCSCHPAGTVGECHPQSGRCPCKANVEGFNCDRCVPGTFNLQADDPRGCSHCFCFGHSTVCTTAPGYGERLISSDFHHGPGGWRGEGPSGQEIQVIWRSKEIALETDGEEEVVYFVAPGRFLGQQHLSFGQQVSVRVRVPEDQVVFPPISLVLEGDGRTVSLTSSSSEDCSFCTAHQRELVFRLSEEEDGAGPFGPSLNFHRLLSNLTAMLIGVGGISSGPVFLRQVSLTSASPGLSGPAPWVEECTCPEGYLGQFCQSCAPGYTRETPSGGPFTSCVPCACNQHGSCHSETGVCLCLHHTEGASCQRCKDGFYGNPYIGRPDDCKPCPCPGGSSCAVIPTSGEVVCTNCPLGQMGRRCELCDDGFFGDPFGNHGPARPCIPCECSGNVDPNAVGNCDPMSGSCLKCLYNTAGNHCQRCREGFHGNALRQDHAVKCIACNCHHAGSAGDPQTCDPVTGQCICLPNVIGRDCSQCRPGFYGMQPGIGCQSCDCHPVGSQSAQCHAITGQCVCHLGVEGVSCHRCHDGYFGFSNRGCRPCNCSPLGSVSPQCYENGTCTCRRGFVGYKCDQCQQNFFYSPERADCEECPTCYSLVKEEANKLRTALEEMETWWSETECTISAYGYHWVQKDASRGDALTRSHQLQEARDVFLEYIGQLENSVSSAWEQLLDSVNISCTGPLEEKSCTMLSELDVTIASVRTEAGLAAGMLRTMVFPRDTVDIPSDWSRLATEFRSVAERHRDVAAEVAAAASQALLASNTSHELLSRALEEDEQRSQQGSEELEERYQEIQARHAELVAALKMATSDAKRAATLIRQVTEKWAHNLSALGSPDPKLLDSRVLDLSTGLAKAEQELVKWDGPLQEMALSQRNAVRQMEDAQQFEQLQQQARSAHTLASEAILEGVMETTEAASLLRTLEGAKKDLDRRKRQAALRIKKAEVLHQKGISEATKKTKQAERILGNATATSAKSKQMAQEAEGTARKSSKSAKDLLREGKRDRKRAALLATSAEKTLEEIMKQERVFNARNKDFKEVELIKMEVATIEETVKKARLALEKDVSSLSRFLRGLETLQSTKQNEAVLSEGWAYLKEVELRLSGSGRLERKLQALQGEAEQQRLKMAEYEAEIAAIQAEKANLQDIARTLPSSCYG